MGIYQLNLKIDKLREDVVRMLGSKQDAINSVAKKSSDRHDTAAEAIIKNEQELTDAEIIQIEQDQMITDHDIAIMELQDALGV